MINAAAYVYNLEVLVIRLIIKPSESRSTTLRIDPSYTEPMKLEAV